jgi:hypothetical protein
MFQLIFQFGLMPPLIGRQIIFMVGESDYQWDGQEAKQLSPREF